MRPRCGGPPVPGSPFLLWDAVPRYSPAMGPNVLIPIGIMLATLLLVFVGGIALYAKLYVKVEAGQALIVNKMSQVDVFFTGGLVVPTVHKAEVMDIRARTLRVERKGKLGLICRDNIRADVVATFYVRVNKVAADVIKVAQTIGAARASDQDTLAQLFSDKFTEAMKTVAKQLDFEALLEKRHEFRNQVLEVIGEDLHGFVMNDLAFAEIEQTPIEMLDPDNILDARGIKKVRELTTAKRREVATLEAECEKLLIEIEAQRGDALAQLRKTTGKIVTSEQLERQLLERLEKLIDAGVERALRKRRHPQMARAVGASPERSHHP